MEAFRGVEWDRSREMEIECRELSGSESPLRGAGRVLLGFAAPMVGFAAYLSAWTFKLDRV
jgi:hypothetical protein